MKIERFLSRYLRADEITRPVRITIARVEAEIVGPEEKEEKIVLYPRGSRRGVVLNKTCIQKLVQLCDSNDTDDWIGQRVEMFRDESITFQGKIVGGIRFRGSEPLPVVAEPDEEPVDLDALERA